MKRSVPVIRLHSPAARLRSWPRVWKPLVAPPVMRRCGLILALLLPLGSAPRPTVDTTGAVPQNAGSGGAPQRATGGAIKNDYGPDDCNDNGIPDDEDLKQGSAEDINHDGTADDCDMEQSVYDWVHGDWQKLAGAKGDTAYVGVLYWREDSIGVLYTVPAGKHRVVVTVRDYSSWRTVVVWNKRQKAGAYRVLWRPSKPDGSFMPRGRADLNVRIGRREYHKFLAWRWRR